MRDKINDAILFAYYGGLLNPHQREIMRLYYDCDMSLAEIGEETSITRQGVRDVIVRSTAKLDECENKLGLVGRIKDIVARMERTIEEGGFGEEQKAELNKLVNEIKEI